MSELAQMAGMLEAKTIIRGKEYVIKPLRIRDLAENQVYEMTAKSDVEKRAFEVCKHLRDNEEITFDFILDLYPDEFKQILEDINKLYPEATEKNE